MDTTFLDSIDRVNFRGKKTTFSGNKKSAGVYFIKENGVIVYIGFSGTCLYSTLYRHFQQWIDNRNKYQIINSSPPYPRVTYYHTLNERDYSVYYTFSVIQEKKLMN